MQSPTMVIQVALGKPRHQALPWGLSVNLTSLSKI